MLGIDGPPAEDGVAEQADVPPQLLARVRDVVLDRRLLADPPRLVLTISRLDHLLQANEVWLEAIDPCHDLGAPFRPVREDVPDVERHHPQHRGRLSTDVPSGPTSHSRFLVKRPTSVWRT